MRNLQRNNRLIEYQLYMGKTPNVDPDGFETGESTTTYGERTPMKVNISPATGYAQVEAFGTLDGYDHVIVTHRMDCPINEESIVWFDGKQYVVRRVAKSLNSLAYAISEAEKSA